MKSILIHCWRGGNSTMNLGEWFNELILAKLGYGIRYWPNGDESPLMLIGSDFNEKSVRHVLRRSKSLWVWGQGHGKDWEKPAKKDDRVHVCAVRGPITAALSGVVGVPLCDPGWLLPWALPLERKPGSEVLHVPHWEQRPGCVPWLDVMFTRNQLVPVIQRLVNAEFVLTSSLHAMIACMAYGTPCALHSLGKLNMPQKWRDVFGEVPPHCETAEDGREWWQLFGRHYRRKQNPEALLAVFPHEIAR